MLGGTRYRKRLPDGRPVGVCDRCGMTFPYAQLKFEWQGLFVCSGADTTNCWEPMHPRLNFVAPTDNSLSMPNPRLPRDANGMPYVDNTPAEVATPSYLESLQAIRARGAS